MIHKMKLKKETKTIYYAFVQKFEVPDNTTNEEIDDLVFGSVMTQAKEPTDYMWSEESDLFDFG